MLRIAPFILLYVCNLSSKSLLYSDILNVTYIYTDTIRYNLSSFECNEIYLHDNLRASRA